MKPFTSVEKVFGHWCMPFEQECFQLCFFSNFQSGIFPTSYSLAVKSFWSMECMSRLTDFRMSLLINVFPETEEMLADFPPPTFLWLTSNSYTERTHSKRPVSKHPCNLTSWLTRIDTRFSFLLSTISPWKMSCPLGQVSMTFGLKKSKVVFYICSTLTRQIKFGDEFFAIINGFFDALKVKKNSFFCSICNVDESNDIFIIEA